MQTRPRDRNKLKLVDDLSDESDEKQEDVEDNFENKSVLIFSKKSIPRSDSTSSKLWSFLSPLDLQNLPEIIPFNVEINILQAIIGVKSTDLENKSDKIYFTKWLNRSYVHCTYESYNDILLLEGGDLALKKFHNGVTKSGLVESLYFSDLFVINGKDVDSNWWEVERLVYHMDNKYLIKWVNLGYDECTWEDANDQFCKGLITQELIDSWLQRKEKKVPTNLGPDDRLLERYIKIDPNFSDKNGNTLRDYQIEGVNWLVYCWCKKTNSILADEMGLGKTVQIVSTLVQLSKLTVPGPFLIIAPLSTLGHWMNTFNNWSSFNAVIYRGKSTEREVIQRYELCCYENGKRIPKMLKCNAVITNYEVIAKEMEFFNSIEWKYFVIDEGHRLKNHQGKFYNSLMKLKFQHCTLMTGTPIQNNVEEFWSLLHFLNPQTFPNLQSFLSEYGNIADIEKVKNFQKTIEPFFLRRKIGDVETSIAEKEETIVEVELTKTQKIFYKAFLNDNRVTLLSQITSSSCTSLRNLVMQLRKVCNHPYLIEGAQDKIEDDERKKNPDIDESEFRVNTLVNTSGKMIFVDKLLQKLKKEGKKVLIFSQMVKVLDIIEEYLQIKKYRFQRIDGRVPANKRQPAIDRFSEDPDEFIFLLCTRAGGTGINLTAATTVIIFDSDFNPQNDLQAQSRCHRIGQTELVTIYRLVTRDTYEISMLDRASKKLGLDQALLEGVERKSSSRDEANEIEQLLRYGVYGIIQDDDSAIDQFQKLDIDEILEQRGKSLVIIQRGNSKFSKAKIDIDQESLDMKSEDFWKKALPDLKQNVVETLPERRCRIKQAQSFETIDDSDSDDTPKKRKQSSGPTGLRDSIRNIIKGGFSNGTALEKYILWESVKLQTALDKDNADILKKLLGVPKLTSRPSDDILYYEEKYVELSKSIQEKAHDIVNRTLLFYKLKFVLYAIQGEVSSWPLLDGDSDPLYDYAICYGVYKNGLYDMNNIFADTGYVSHRPMTEKVAIQTVENILFHFRDLLVRKDIESDHVILPPNEWKLIHENLFNRLYMSNEEYFSLLNHLSMLGTPEIPDEEGNPIIDYKRIIELFPNKCLSDEVVKSSIDSLLAVIDGKDDQETLMRLKNYKTSFRKIKETIVNLKKFRDIYPSVTDSDKVYFLNKVSEKLPSFWTQEHNDILFKNICDTGYMHISTWIVDRNGPFFKHIPQDFAQQFDISAAQEEVFGRPCKPREAEPFSFLYNTKIRYEMVKDMIFFAEKQIRRSSRTQSSNHIHDIDDVERDIVTEVPPVPYEINSTLRITNFGSYQRYDDQYPINYKSERLYVSIADPNTKSWYESSTFLDGEGKFCFKVRHLSEPFKEYVSNKPSNAWEMLLIDLESVKKKFKLPLRKFTAVSGPVQYGFSQDKVVKILNFIRDSGS